VYHMKKIAATTLLALLLPSAILVGAEETLPKGFTKVRTLEGITEYALENGLTVLLFPDPTKEKVTVNITYKVGSKNENYGETGMAHLLEHLVFKGTPRHPNILEELTAHGAIPNGTTWVDRTNYFEIFNATDENLEWALDLEADRMVNSYIAKKDLDSEMTVVRNEFERGEDSPERMLMQRMLSAAFMWHNYGKSTIGARSDIENVPIDRLQAFYRKYYQPDNAVLIVAGKIDANKTLALIDRYFSPLPRPDRVLPKVYTVDPTQDGEREVTLRRVGDIQMVAASYHVPPGSHEDFAALSILSDLLADAPSGRLYKSLVETKMADRVYDSLLQWQDPSVAMFTARVSKEADLLLVRNQLLDSLEGIAANPIADNEVNQARTRLLKRFELSMNSSTEICLGLSEWIAMGDWRMLFLHRDRLEKVTTAQVNDVALRYFKRANRTLGYFIPTEKPDRAEIPAAPDLQALLADYKGREAVVMGEAFDPTPENIEAHTVRISLDGGMRLALLPKKTRGESVTANIRFHFGSEKSLANRATVGNMVADMLMRGTEHMSREEIQRKLDELKAQVRVRGGADGVSISLETLRANLGDTLKVIGEVMREPGFPEAELELLKNNQIAQLEQGRSDPRQIAFRELRRHFNQFPPEHPNYAMTLEEELAAIQAVTIDQVRDFYRTFYGASFGDVAVVGDFDKEAITRLLDKTFGDWKTPTPYERIDTAYKEVQSDRRIFETPDKANAVFLAGLNFEMVQDDEDYAALQIGNFILGGGGLNSRLGTRLRQQEGLSYGVGSMINVDARDNDASFRTFAICAPENMEKLEKAFYEELERMQTEGFTEKELAQAKSGFLQGRRISRSEDGRLAGMLAGYLELGRTLEWDAKYEQQVDQLDLTNVNRVLKQYVKPANLTLVEAGDFEKKNPEGQN